MMQKAVFPGSFDPPTLGHLNLIERSGALFDEVLVVIAANSQKKYLFSAEERLAMLEELVIPWKNVSVFVWDSLISDFMKQHGSKLLVRGVRAESDFGYELEISFVYKGLDPSMETIFIPTDPRFFTIRSSIIKELASFHADVSCMVPPLVAGALKEKYKLS